jgi:hypothetical protein
MMIWFMFIVMIIIGAWFMLAATIAGYENQNIVHISHVISSKNMALCGAVFCVIIMFGLGLSQIPGEIEVCEPSYICQDRNNGYTFALYEGELVMSSLHKVVQADSSEIRVHRDRSKFWLDVVNKPNSPTLQPEVTVINKNDI